MGFDIRRGVNISHWLSQSTRRGEERTAWFTHDDVRRIADMGFDHIRLPIDEVQMWDDEGHREHEPFGLLDAALRWCDEASLRVVVDLHILRSHYFNDDRVPPLWTEPAACEKFCSLWADLCEFLGDWPHDNVAFEFLNEAVAPDPADWNRVSEAVRQEIRRHDADRLVVLGSNDFNQTRTYNDLAIPDDPNLLLTFHFYEPMLLTHYRASWTFTRDYHGPTRYPGTPIDSATWETLSQDQQRLLGPHNHHFDRDQLEALLAKPLARAAKANKKLYCGEFGCVSDAPEADRQRWYRDVVDLFAEHDIAWAAWDYAGNRFGVVDPETRQPNDFAGILLS